MTSRDTTELELKGKLYLESEKPPTVKDFMTINSKTGDSILIRGTHSFFYNDKFYTNHYLPGDATANPHYCLRRAKGSRHTSFIWLKH